MDSNIARGTVAQSSNALIPCPETLRASLDGALVWYYFGRNISFPRQGFIARSVPSYEGMFATASEVFRAFQVDIGKLREIFNREPLNTTVSDDPYENLGGLLWTDDVSWQALAGLVGYDIILLRQNGRFETLSHMIYCRDGRIYRL